MAKSAKSRVWLITGSSTGFGRVLAEELIDRGERVVATARKPDALVALRRRSADRLHAVALDVTDPAACGSAVDAALNKFGRIDVVVNNAGYGLLGALEETSEEQARRVFETNVFGLLNVTRAALPTLRRQGSGHIVNLSSIAGLVANGGMAIYNATKFAVEGLSEALSKEVASFGIKVTVVEPGAFRTDFSGRSLDEVAPMPEYEPAIGMLRKRMRDLDGKQDGDPVKAARAIIAAVDAPEPPLRLVLLGRSIDSYRSKLQTELAALAKWEALGRDTAFTAGQS